MNNQKIHIDLKDFEGKTVLELKREIQNQLGKIRIFYSASNPINPNRTFDYYPYESFDFSNNHNSEIIKEIKIE